MYTTEQLLDELKLFRLRNGGLGSWITENTAPVVLDRLGKIDEDPITKVQLNQLLAFGHEYRRISSNIIGSKHQKTTPTM
jgi:hypothetical protein